MPATVKRWYLGTRPSGVSSPCGLVTRMVSPTAAPMVWARSWPMTMGGRMHGCASPVAGCGSSASARALLDGVEDVGDGALVGGDDAVDERAAGACAARDEDLFVEAGSGGGDMGQGAQAGEQRTPVADAVAGDAHEHDVRGGADRRSCRSRRMPLVMARAMMSEATPAATPMTEMAVMTPTTAWRRWPADTAPQ